MKTNNRVLQISIISMLIISTLFIVYRVKKKSGLEYHKTVRAEYRSVDETLTISGEIRPQKVVEIKSTISGILEDLYVKVGDDVINGQSIAKIQYVKEPLEVRRLLKSLDMAKEEYENVNLVFLRTQQLFDAGYVSQESYENDKIQLKLKELEYQSLLSEIEMLRGNYENANVSNVINSTVRGIILDLPIETGGSVMARGTLSEGSTIAKIANIDSLVFKGEVLETDVSDLKVGMPITFEVASMKEHCLTGVLSQVSPLGTIRDGITRFGVTATLNIPDSCRNYVRAGCSANASFVKRHKDRVLTLDEKYFKFSYDSVYVNVIVGKGVVEKRFLKTGLSNGIYTEIIAGLDTLDNVKVN
ncbi:MAG: efflux RND transporter periplasmic adaptor subunit [Marinilabiliaceae bacterium]|nr:efflux RND transporter periplasmic adaptor subunit [Marinilabiliaceae bacterium]